MIKERKDVDKKYKWDLSKIFPSDEEFYKAYSETEKLIKDFKKHEKTMIRSAEELYSTLCEYVLIDDRISLLWQYANLNFSTDTSNNSYQSLNAKVRDLAVRFGAVAWFVSPFILKLNEKTLDGWYTEYPDLLRFKRLIDKELRYKPHTLSDEEEKDCNCSCHKQHQCKNGEDNC